MLLSMKYTNKNIKKVFGIDVILLWVGAGIFVIGMILFLSGLWTADKLVKQLKPIEQVLSAEGNHANKTAYINITDSPVKITEDEYEGYYLVTDGEHLYISGMQEADYDRLNADYKEDGRAVLYGITKVIIDEAVREELAEYLSSNGVHCNSETIDDYIGDVQIRVCEISFPSMLKEGASVQLILGGLLWVLGIFFVLNELNRLSKYRKIICIQDVKPAQLDAETNAPEAVYLDEISIYLTPSFVVSLYDGITALRYDEITDIFISKPEKENSGNKIRITARAVNYTEYLLHESTEEILSQYQEDDIYILKFECEEHNVNLVCDFEE